MKTSHRLLTLSLCCCALTATLPGRASADGTVGVSISTEGQDLATSLGIDATEFQESINQKLSDAFDTLRPKDYLRAISDAVAFSNRGIGVDYASGNKRFELGVAGNLSIALGDQGLGEIDADRPVAGVAPNFSLMFGWNLEEFGYPAITVFGNGFHHSAGVGDFQGSATNAGAHAQVRLFRNRGKDNLRKLVFLWGGVDITSGLEFTRLGLTLENELETKIPLEGNMPIDVLLTSRGKYALTATALTVPLEVTTSVRAFYFFWLYGGVGADLQLGGSSIDAKLDGTMVAIDPSTQEEVEVGTASIEVNEDSGPSVGKLRFLAGLQAEVLFAKVFVQANLLPDRGAGVAFGMRAAF